MEKNLFHSDFFLPIKVKAEQIPLIYMIIFQIVS